MSDDQRGLYGKYNVTRRDGKGTYPSDKHFNCQYFVLDVTHDPYAIPALAAYAEASQAEYPALAADLRDLVSRAGERDDDD